MFGIFPLKIMGEYESFHIASVDHLFIVLIVGCVGFSGRSFTIY